MTIHNHRFDQVMPSIGDLNKNLEHGVTFGVITSDNRIGVIKFNSKFTEEKKDSFLSQYAGLRSYMTLQLHGFYGSKLDKISKEEYNELFEKFVSENIDRYVNEFNLRLKEYNVEMTYIILR